jgi:hypothetical protein
LEADDEELQTATETKPARFKKKKWNHAFEVTPELLRWDIYIDVYTNTNATTIAAIDREQKLDLLNKLWAMGQWIMAAKQAGLDVESILPIKDVLRDLASDYWLTIQDKWDQEDVKIAKEKLMTDLQAMMGGGQTEWGITNEEWAGAPPPETPAPQWIPL